MTRQGWLVTLALAGLLGLALLFAQHGNPGPSALSHEANGWLAARRYLEARDIAVRLRDRPLDEPISEPTLISAFPWTVGTPASTMAPLRHWIEQGGTLILAYGTRQDPTQEKLFEALGLATTVARSEAPLGFAAWRQWTNEQWSLTPSTDLGATAQPLTLRAPAVLPQPPREAEVLYRHGDGPPVIFRFTLGSGAVIVLPAELLANARLSQPGHADLLETLVVARGEPVAFDEYHHGLAAAHTPAASRPRLAFDLFLLHLVGLYVLALFALGRRFGPAWSEPPARTGSAGAFLRGLGRLHDRLGHHAEAGRLLLARVAELDPRFEAGAGLRQRAAPANGRELRELAEAVAAARGYARSSGRETDKETR